MIPLRCRSCGATVTLPPVAALREQARIGARVLCDNLACRANLGSAERVLQFLSSREEVQA